MSAAWGKFHSLWPVLRLRDGNLGKRLQLVDACVSQTALWCSESWLLTEKQKRLLQSTENAMLRRIVGANRRPDESWVDWLKRSTRKAVSAAREHGVRIWKVSYLKSKWTWAGHVSRMDSARIARRAVTWRDSQWQATEYLMPNAVRIRRPGRRRWFRWEDDLHRYAEKCGWQSWQRQAMHREVWQAHCERFVNFIKR